MQKKLFVLILTCLLAACGGREAHPVATTTPYDDQLSCDHLRAELAVNNHRISDLLGEKDNNENLNIGMLVISPLFLDLSHTEQVEIQALQQRNEVLNDLISKRCIKSKLQ